MNNIKVFLSNSLRRIKKRLYTKQLPLTGYPIPEHTPCHVDVLCNDDLIKLNALFDWNCFTVDALGRRFGSVGWNNKRINPEIIPDRRILLMQNLFNLKNKSVLEIGCFEGIHTVGLSQYAKNLIAVDSRLDHVAKTLMRCAMYGYYPKVFKCDIESPLQVTNELTADVLHHVGVLYHLKDPISHLLNIGDYIKEGLMLDTHYALPEECTSSYVVNGISYRYKYYQEYGVNEAFSGMYDHSKWLTLDDIISCLKISGFKKISIIEQRNERNGPRVLLFAQRIEIL